MQLVQTEPPPINENIYVAQVFHILSILSLKAQTPLLKASEVDKHQELEMHHVIRGLRLLANQLLIKIAVTLAHVRYW